MITLKRAGGVLLHDEDVGTRGDVASGLELGKHPNTRLEDNDIRVVVEAKAAAQGGVR